MSALHAPAPSSPAPADRLPGVEQVMGQAQAENFTVASRLLPRAARRDLLALYGFARLVDDIGDELTADTTTAATTAADTSTDDRLAALDWLEEELDRAFAGRATSPLLLRLTPTLKRCELPRAPFAALIEANRLDQRVHEYETFEQLLGYCELSANPVGQLVLGVLGLATPQRIERSDAICTALQLVEHWQDVAEDLRRGRIYLPAADMRGCGCTRDDLAPGRGGPGVRRLLALEIMRTRGLLEQGRPLVGMLRGRPRVAIAAYVAGGKAALDAVQRAGDGVLGGPPRATRTARLLALVATLAGAGR